MVPHVELPAGFISDDDFWKDMHVPNTRNIKEHLRREGRITPGQMQLLIDLVYDIFCSEDNVIYIDAPLTVCGDIHGQYYDLLKLFEIGGDPENTRYLFLGDYVDRGNFSIECVLLLFAYKVAYPDTFFLIRGNHECRHITEYFTFKEELIYKYDISTYNSIMDTFDALPLVAIMNKQFFCVHGGISPDIGSIEEIIDINRFQETTPAGPMCDLLWADPIEEYDSVIHPVNTSYEDLFTFNGVRGCSYTFPYQAALDFLEKKQIIIHYSSA
jgi:serine/threonine-protein phosphatase 2B catalytic subunit